MKIILQIDGGTGKCIAATAVCKAIKAQHPGCELIVVSGYPEVFFGNKNIDENLGFNDRIYFYQRHIKDKDFKLCAQNPYLETDFVARRGHLNKVWSEMFGFTYNNELPELFINSREQGFYSNKYISEKPIFVIQTNGGAKDQPNKYSWARDMPIGAAQQLVNAFAKDYTVVHIRREDQLVLQNTIPVHEGFRGLCVLLMMAQKRLLIDSFAQHAAAALGLPSVVFWIANTPEQFGYNIHTNIHANPYTLQPELRHAVYSEANIGGDPVEFPYNHEGEIMDMQKVYDALQNTPSVITPQPADMPSAAPAIEAATDAPTEAEPEKQKENGKTKKALKELENA